LLNTLRASTVQKYTRALESLNSELRAHHRVWHELTEDEQDYFLAEWILDGYEAGGSKNEFSWALSAVQKIHPRLRLRTAWKVLDAWTSLVPVRQAPAAPPELLQAMVVLGLTLGRPQLSLVMLLAYAGLLRIREALTLKAGDLIVQGSSIIACLGRTKRGLEQKVILTNPSVVDWVCQFLARFPQKHPQHGLFAISYSSALRWVRRLAELLGLNSCTLQLTPFEGLEPLNCLDKVCHYLKSFYMVAG
jgi:hypothetical protein